MKIDVQFEEYHKSEEYVEGSQQLELKGFNIDETTENILLILRPKPSSDKKTHKSEIYLKIWDTNADKIIFENYIMNKSLIGIFQTSCFIYVGDHLYFNNNVIKIRTDLMVKNNRNVPEEFLFCEYTNIINVHKNEHIKINSPL